MSQYRKPEILGKPGAVCDFVTLFVRSLLKKNEKVTTSGTGHVFVF